MITPEPDVGVVRLAGRERSAAQIEDRLMAQSHLPSEIRLKIIVFRCHLSLFKCSGRTDSTGGILLY
jgi:hypothetical protein